MKIIKQSSLYVKEEVDSKKWKCYMMDSIDWLRYLGLESTSRKYWMTLMIWYTIIKDSRSLSIFRIKVDKDWLIIILEISILETKGLKKQSRVIRMPLNFVNSKSIDTNQKGSLCRRVRLMYKDQNMF